MLAGNRRVYRGLLDIKIRHIHLTKNQFGQEQITSAAVFLDICWGGCE